MKKQLTSLSNKMKKIGNMHKSYKGLAMHSKMSTEMHKSMLLFFIKHYGDISLICCDHENQKVIWYNKPLYHHTHTAIIYIDDAYFVCVRNISTILNTFLYQERDKSMQIMDFLQCMDIFNEDDLHYDSLAIQQPFEKGGCLCMSLLNSVLPLDRYATVQKAEDLRFQLGLQIYEYLLKHKKTPTDLAEEFNQYVLKNYEKIVYVMC
jgi:hypothetical protein